MPSSVFQEQMSKIDELAAEAETLRKAIIMCDAWLGKSPLPSLINVPQYHSYSIHALKELVVSVEDAMDEMLCSIVQGKLPPVQKTNVIRWFSTRYDEWEKQRGILSLGTVQAVENQIGQLALHRTMDCPPYGELLIQGFIGIAVRHPEYHLVRDLALMHTLFRNSQVNTGLQSRGIGASQLLGNIEWVSASRAMVNLGDTELTQSLARMVILVCFNLLEAFVSGLATGWQMEHPTASPEQTLGLFREGSLKKRLLNTTRFVTQRADLFDEQKAPILPLFGEIKCMRDSFVHCQPGDEPTKWGYVKEELFHDVPAAVVEEAVSSTETIICETWKALTDRDRPTWFPQRLPDGRFRRMEVKLASET